MPNLTMDVLHVSAPPKHGAKGYQRMTYWLNMVIFVSHNKSKRGIISGIPTTSGWEIELGSTKTSRSGVLFYFPLARQELLTTATAALSRDFCYHAATKKSSTLQVVICYCAGRSDFAWLCIVSGNESKNSRYRFLARGLCTSGILILIQASVLFGSCFRLCGHKPSIMCCCGLKVSLDLMNHGEIVEWAAYLCGIKTAGKKDRTHSEMCFFLWIKVKCARGKLPNN